MAIDTAEKRRSISGITSPVLIPGVTPNASPDVQWRSEAAGGYSALESGPSDIRVESNSPTSNTLRWTAVPSEYASIYRSTDGISYLFLDTAEPIDTEVYEDNGDRMGGSFSASFPLLPKTKYWYKISNDAGSTFSAPVTVVTHVEKAKSSSSNQFVATTDVESLARQLEDKLNGQSVASQPCDVCIVDGAIVIDCRTGCEWFKVIVDQDINSISLVGCDDCPPIDFIVPPNVTRGVCGWPVGCEYQGDECFQAPIVGGEAGRTGKTTGESFEGYSDASGGGKPGPCPCSLTTPVNMLAIECCETDGTCLLSCSGDRSVSVRACGGMAPYFWEISGSILSLTDAAGITVTASVGITGATVTFPRSARTTVTVDHEACSGCQPAGDVAFVEFGMYSKAVAAGPCSEYNTTPTFIFTVSNDAKRQYDCNMNLVPFPPFTQNCDFVLTTPPHTTPATTVTLTYTDCLGVEHVNTGGSIQSGVGVAGATGEYNCSWLGTLNHSITVAEQRSYLALQDVRTAEEITAGCCP